MAVFVDGCFWHGCDAHLGRASKSNVDYWVPKIEANKLRDFDTAKRLTDAGWTVIRVWEHESVDAVANRVEGVVRKKRPST